MVDFLTSILANVATLALAGLVIYLVGWIKRRRMLLRFFTGQSSLLPSCNRFLIHISTLNRSPGGLSSVWEFTEARNLQDLFFSLVPGPSGNPGLFRDFMVSGLECEIQAVREGDNPDILPTNCLVVGSPMFNDAAQKYQRQLTSPVYFEPTDPANRLSAYRLHVPHERPNDDERRGVIVRICRDGKSYFYAAGRTEYSTAGALYLLRRKWHELYKHFGADKSFVVQVQAASDDYRLVSEVSRSGLLPSTTPAIQAVTASFDNKAGLTSAESGAYAPPPSPPPSGSRG